MEEKNKKQGKGKIITIIILILLVLGLSGFIVYDKVLYKYFEKKEVKEEKNEEDKIDQTIVDELVNRYKLLDKNDAIIVSDTHITPKQIGNIIISMAGDEFKDSDDYELEDDFELTTEIEKKFGGMSSLSASVYEEKFQELFGPDEKLRRISTKTIEEFEKTGALCDELVYYEPDNMYFTDRRCGYPENGGVFATLTDINLKNYTLENNILIISILNHYDDSTEDTLNLKFKKASDGKYYYYLEG